MNKKDLLSLLFIIFFTITICLHGYFTDEFSTINLNRTAEEHVFNKSSIYDYNAEYFDEYLTNKSSSSVDKVQQDILDIENLKVPGTIAMAISESYPFKNNEIWNPTISELIDYTIKTSEIEFYLSDGEIKINTEIAVRYIQYV